MGLGVLGTAVPESLRSFGFRCAGWSRSPHRIDGVECCSGTEGLQAFLARTDILIASMTQPETAVDALIDNLRRHRENLPLIGLVDRGRGY